MTNASFPTHAQRLCHLDDVPDGDARGFDPQACGQDSVLVVRQGSHLHGYLDICPHYGDTPLPWRRHAYLNGARDKIVCAAHGALFDIATGACVSGPCLGQSLTPVRLQVEADGAVYALAPAPD